MVYNKYKFTCSGDFDVDVNLDRIYDSVGNVVGFKLPDGREVRLVIALEVDNEDNYDYITSESDMDELGFNLTDYDVCEFVLNDE